MRLNRDEHFQSFIRRYLDLLKTQLKQIQVMIHNGDFSWQGRYKIFTILPIDFDLERWRFLDLSWYCYIQVTEA